MRVSVIITTYNRAGHLKYGLYSVMGQKFKPYEVLVVDDGSTDHTERVVREAKEKWPTIRYIYNRNPGYTNGCLAKNIGVRQAAGDLLIFTEPEVLHIGETMMQHVLRHGDDTRLFISTGTVYFVFGGVVKMLSLADLRDPKRIVRAWDAKEWKDGYEPQADEMAVNRHVCATYCASVKREDVMRIGGYDERLLKWWGWEDLDLQSRLSRDGVTCLPDPSMQVVHLAHGRTGCFEVWEYNRRLHEDPDKPTVANQGREWGVIRT